MCTQNELQIILKKIVKVYREVYGDNIVKVILYGSYSRGDYEKDSDIDIVAIVNGNRELLQKQLVRVWDASSDLELEYETIVSPTVIPYDNRIDLMKYRMKMAKERLESAKLLLDNGQFKDSIGRSYYAMFTSVRAILALDGQDFSKHAGVISYFQKNYIKTGVFDVKYSKYLSQAFQIRNNTDYADFFIVSATDAREQYEKAMDFYKEIDEYIKKQ